MPLTSEQLASARPQDVYRLAAWLGYDLKDLDYPSAVFFLTIVLDLE